MITGQVPHPLMTDHWLSCSLHVRSWCSLLTRGHVVVVPEVPGVVVAPAAPVQAAAGRAEASPLMVYTPTLQLLQAAPQPTFMATELTTTRRVTATTRPTGASRLTTTPGTSGTTTTWPRVSSEHQERT
jgi:hypothetical protein